MLQIKAIPLETALPESYSCIRSHLSQKYLLKIRSIPLQVECCKMWKLKHVGGRSIPWLICSFLAFFFARHFCLAGSTLHIINLTLHIIIIYIYICISYHWYLVYQDNSTPYLLICWCPMYINMKITSYFDSCKNLGHLCLWHPIFHHVTSWHPIFQVGQPLWIPQFCTRAVADSLKSCLGPNPVIRNGCGKFSLLILWMFVFWGNSRGECIDKKWWTGSCFQDPWVFIWLKSY